MRAAMSARTTIALACALGLALLATGCGGSDSEGGGSETVASRPAPPRGAFPAAEGRTLQEVLKSADEPAPVVVSPAALVFRAGENRYPFGVFELDRTPVPDAEVALYIAKVPPPPPPAEDLDPEDNQKPKGPVARARSEGLEQTAVGPFPAKVESLGTRPAFRASTTVDDPNAPKVVYVTDLEFPSEGEWRVAALVRDGDELGATLLPSAVVGEFDRVPRVGERAPVIHTPTAADVGGDLSKVTTRVPPDTQNEADFADVLGEKPIVLLFSTPQFCQSRVCGPVVDVAEQVKETHGEGIEFIHMEIYSENDPGKGVRPQVRAYRLPSEPWLFAIDGDGVIRAAVEGPFGTELLTGVVEGLREG